MAHPVWTGVVLCLWPMSLPLHSLPILDRLSVLNVKGQNDKRTCDSLQNRPASIYQATSMSRPHKLQSSTEISTTPAQLRAGRVHSLCYTSPAPKFFLPVLLDTALLAMATAASCFMRRGAGPVRKFLYTCQTGHALSHAARHSAGSGSLQVWTY